MWDALWTIIAIVWIISLLESRESQKRRLTRRIKNLEKQKKLTAALLENRQDVIEKQGKMISLLQDQKKTSRIIPTISESVLQLAHSTKSTTEQGDSDEQPQQLPAPAQEE